MPGGVSGTYPASLSLCLLHTQIQPKSKSFEHGKQGLSALRGRQLYRSRRRRRGRENLVGDRQEAEGHEMYQWKAKARETEEKQMKAFTQWAECRRIKRVINTDNTGKLKQSSTSRICAANIVLM